MNFLKKSTVALLCVTVMSTTALADVGIATISDVNGKVLVNAGEGFVPVSLNMKLKAGDRILVGEDSTALVAYENCAVVLDKPSVVAIKDEVVCNAPNGSTLVQPVADVYVPSTPAAAGIPPVVLLTTVGIAAVTCALACDEIFGKKNRGVSGN